jgi:hypothetical protein
MRYFGRPLLVTVAAVMVLPAGVAVASQSVRSLTLCGTVTATAAPRHVIIVMLENRGYKQVIGNSAAPFENSLASSCGVATSMWGATHWSASNYLAVRAGEYPATSVHGCDYPACADASTSIYQQLDSAGRTWKAYEESMPSACDKSSAAPYKIGHNPPIFYTAISATECKARDLGVTNLTAQSGAFWDDLQAGTLPSVSWITPNTSNDGENSCGGNCALSIADTWLGNVVSLVAGSPEYQSGNTVIFITYDEGRGPDATTGENCTSETADLAGAQPSCHVPFFVIYPGTTAGTHDSTFSDHYSLTRTIEDFFGLPYLSHAAGTQTASLTGHFGLPKQAAAAGPACRTLPRLPTRRPSLAATTRPAPWSWLCHHGLPAAIGRPANPATHGCKPPVFPPLRNCHSLRSRANRRDLRVFLRCHGPHDIRR